MTRKRLVVLVTLALAVFAGTGLGLWYYGNKRAPVVSRSIARPVTPVKAQEKKEEKPSKPEKYRIYRIKKGDTLSGISRNYGIDQKTIAADNNLKEPDKIYAGKTLKLRLSAMKKKLALRVEAKPKAKAEKEKKKAPEKVAPKKKVASKKTRGAAFKEWVFSLWKYPGKNAYKGDVKKAKESENVHEALVAMLGNTKYRELIPTFEEKIRNKKFFLKDIQKGEVFDLMVSTKKGKTVVGRRIKEAWDSKWVKKHQVSQKAERYTVEFEGEEVMLTFAYACGNWAITLKPMPPSPPPPAILLEKGRILIKKEAIDFKQNIIQPVPQFGFCLDNCLSVEETFTDANGDAVFKNVEPGTHTVTEMGTGLTWETYITPEGGKVEVRAGEDVAVHFKNIQILPPAEVPPPTSTPPEQPSEITPPSLALPPLREIKRLVSCYGLEHEPSAGTGGWKNGLARGHFVWGDHVSWYQGKCGDPIWLGLGAFGAYDSGQSRVSSFMWRGYRVSPNFAVRGYYPYETKEGDERYRMFKFNFRFPAYDVQRGHNKEVPKFKSTQRTFPMIGIWTEGEQGINELWTVGTFADAWISLRTERHASFSARPDRKDSFMLGLWAQRKVSDNWDARLIIAPFWQRWDNLSGFHVRPELRYKNFFIFGPFANLFPHRSAVYRKGGVRLWRLQTWGGFLRLELRGPLNKLYDRERVKEVIYTEEKPNDEIKAFESDAASTEIVSVEAEGTLQTPSLSEEEGLKTGIKTVSQDPEPTHEESHPVNPVNPEIANDLPPDLE